MNKKNWQPCPRCNSSKVVKQGFGHWFFYGFSLIGISIIFLFIFPTIGITGLICALIFMIIAPFMFGRLKCKDCNLTWKYK